MLDAGLVGGREKPAGGAIDAPREPMAFDHRPLLSNDTETENCAW
jgi:hypothetical protein